MSKQDRDILDDMFRTKLYDYEVDTAPEDWEMIVSRLPESKPVVRTLNRRRWLYGAAAAVVAALVVTTGLLFVPTETGVPILAEQSPIEQPVQPKQEEEQPSIPVIDEPETPMIAAATATAGTGQRTNSTYTTTTTHAPVSSRTTTLPADSTPGDVATGDENKDKPEVTGQDTETVSTESYQQESRPVITESTTSLMADATTYTAGTSKPKTRRWGFGMGGGGLGVDATNTINTLTQVSAMSQPDDDMLVLNAPTKSVNYQTELKHKTPVNVGVSAAYYINNRWALNFGLSYSLLVSETKQKASYHRDEEQRLHYLGIPVSISYRIAEWQNFNFYAAAGFMPEINVAGKFKTERWAGDGLMGSSTESVRMREMYWSVNGRAGVSYPVFKYMHAFAEVGAGYYFDNKSEIQTIHSEKPFNVSFNFGLRFGF